MLLGIILLKSRVLGIALRTEKHTGQSQDRSNRGLSVYLRYGTMRCGKSLCLAARIRLMFAVDNLQTHQPMRHGLAIKTPESHPVKCRGCHRTVHVILSDRYPPCFHYLEQRADCPEIQTRRRRSEGNL